MSGLFGYSFKSYVDVEHAEKTANVKLKTGESTTLEDLIKENVPHASKGYSYWNKLGLGNGDTQTLYAGGADFEKVDHIYYGRRLLTWENGDTVSADYVVDGPSSKDHWDEQVSYSPRDDLPKFPVRTRYLTPEEILSIDNPQEKKPLWINLHGLSGGSHESYVRSQINTVMRKYAGEFDIAVLNSRGCARTRITTPILFNAAMTEDIRRFVRYIRKTQPDRKIYLAGYSLGACILANYLGQEGDDCVITGAICLACPWDMMASSYHLNRTFLGRNLYVPIMTKNLNRLAYHHREKLSELDWFKEAMSLAPPKSLPEYDDRYTSRMFGFDSAHDYYRHCSPVNRLMSVRVPLLILNSFDDPIVGSDGIPHREVKRNPYLYMVTTTCGGHLGWFQSDGDRWNNEVVADFLHALDTKVDHSTGSGVHAEVFRPHRLWDGHRLVFDGINP